MRYKIKVPDKDLFADTLELLRENAVVRTISENRLTISADDVSIELHKLLEERGISIEEDSQYDLD